MVNFYFFSFFNFLLANITYLIYLEQELWEKLQIYLSCNIISMTNPI